MKDYTPCVFRTPQLINLYIRRKTDCILHEDKTHAINSCTRIWVDSILSSFKHTSKSPPTTPQVMALIIRKTGRSHAMLLGGWEVSLKKKNSLLVEWSLVCFWPFILILSAQQETYRPWLSILKVQNHSYTPWTLPAVEKKMEEWRPLDGFYP